MDVAIISLTLAGLASAVLNALREEEQRRTRLADMLGRLDGFPPATRPDEP